LSSGNKHFQRILLKTARNQIELALVQDIDAVTRSGVIMLQQSVIAGAVVEEFMAK
jgi:hypothetical protein